MSKSKKFLISRLGVKAVGVVVVVGQGRVFDKSDNIRCNLFALVLLKKVACAFDDDLWKGLKGLNVMTEKEDVKHQAE